MYDIFVYGPDGTVLRQEPVNYTIKSCLTVKTAARGDYIFIGATTPNFQGKTLFLPSGRVPVRSSSIHTCEAMTPDFVPRGVVGNPLHALTTT
jgi:hypothetical protein